ncbi:MAG: hypothetical protein DWQ47_13620 [Acidobacteria bacterium]|nr:MAG: hypothetical protein DWQ32_01020 [Acidobacteriota bacterium]REK02887.1 MAG: hypothetical protein DWQ38_11115 [Acidobacteriota bacterium]REK13309.1 MAG: hypothetical protein DWQ43_06710 [Acidobacteriota bacterium]REK41303.1 MAG: hypothetical protein DWQ47_13620 [Acidobacteriota bacterium]
MKTFKRILLVAGCLLIVAQIPFAVNRFRTARLADRIEQMSATRVQVPELGFSDYKGVIHIHSFLGGHSTGTFEELIDAADQNGLDFVVMTEHVSDEFDTAGKTLNKEHGNALWLGGNEASTTDGDKFLVFDGYDGVAALQKYDTDGFIRAVHGNERLAMVTYPEQFSSWDAEIDGIEVFSLHTNAKQMNPVFFILDAIWSYGAYPELTLARHFERPEANLERYDNLAKTKRLLLFGGNDAHSNIGLHLGDDANNKFLELKYDRYATIFRIMRTHVFLPSGKELNRENLLKAFGEGRSYLGLDILGDPSGFGFYADNGSGVAMMGDEMSGPDTPTLYVTSPLPARIVILRDGASVFESEVGNAAEFKVTDSGSYRVEAYLDGLGAPFDRMPWVISNPIYIRKQSEQAPEAVKPTHQNGATS